MGFSGNGAHPRKGAVGFKLVEVPAGRVSPHSSEVVAVLVAAEGPGWASHSNQASLVWRALCGLVGVAAVPVGGGGAWPGFETTHPATRQRHSTTGVEGVGGTGGHGRASRRGAERSEALASRAAGPPAPGIPVGHAKQPGPAGGTNQNLRNWEASRSTARSAGNAIL